MPAVALIASPTQQELIRSLSRQVEVAGLVGVGRGRFAQPPAPVFADLARLLGAVSPAVLCALAPHPGLLRDVELCVERGIHVLGAGPVPGSSAASSRLCLAASQRRVRFAWGGLHHFSPLYHRLREQRLRPGFGEPVYLRQVRDGGRALLPAWWAACQSLAMAQDLAGSPACDVHLAATRNEGRLHLALTLTLADRTIAHLVVGPAFAPGGDVLLVGSGGLLSSDALANAPAVLGATSAILHPPAFLWPEPAWLLDFVARLEHEPVPLAASSEVEYRLLRGLRRALRQGGVARILSIA